MAGRTLAALVPIALLTACAATQSPAMVAPAAPGFWLGLWHGFIFPVAWIVSLFRRQHRDLRGAQQRRLVRFRLFPRIVVFGVGARKTQVVYRDNVIDVRAKRVHEVGS